MKGDRSWSVSELADFRRYAALGWTARMISERLDRSLRTVSHELTLWRAEQFRERDSSGVVADRLAEKDMLARIMQDGGFPRTVATPQGTIWVGVDNLPWHGPSAPPPAKPSAARRVA